MSSELPAGTVTLLFTDVEGSTRLLQADADRYRALLADHNRILTEAASAHAGRVVDTQGDSFFVVFGRALDAVAAAVDIQRRFGGGDTGLRVRIGIHTGEPVVGGDRYIGLAVHRAARICAAGHGGQVLISQATRELIRETSTEFGLADLGEHRLKDLDEPERLYQVEAAGLEREFPPLRTDVAVPFSGRERALAKRIELSPLIRIRWGTEGEKPSLRALVRRYLPAKRRSGS